MQVINPLFVSLVDIFRLLSCFERESDEKTDISELQNPVTNIAINLLWLGQGGSGGWSDRQNCYISFLSNKFRPTLAPQSSDRDRNAFNSFHWQMTTFLPANTAMIESVFHPYASSPFSTPPGFEVALVSPSFRCFSLLLTDSIKVKRRGVSLFYSLLSIRTRNLVAFELISLFS